MVMVINSSAALRTYHHEVVSRGLRSNVHRLKVSSQQMPDEGGLTSAVRSYHKHLALGLKL
jgi:hypothetical protein